MGTIQHDALLITTYDDDSQKIREKIWEIASRYSSDTGAPMDSLVLHGRSVMNGYGFVVVIPDGSKEWWGTSDVGDQMRAEIEEFCVDPATHAHAVAVSWGELRTSIREVP